MSELSNQIEQFKARRQRFALAAERHLNKGREIADIKQCEILERQLLPQPVARREYTPRYVDETPVMLPIIWRIKHAVATEFNISVTTLLSRCRLADLCVPRYVAIGLMLELTRMSLPAIGRQMGGRDHTTIINGRNRLDQLLKSEAFRNRFEQIKETVAG